MVSGEEPSENATPPKPRAFTPTQHKAQLHWLRSVERRSLDADEESDAAPSPKPEPEPDGVVRRQLEVRARARVSNIPSLNLICVRPRRAQTLLRDGVPVQAKAQQGATGLTVWRPKLLWYSQAQQALCLRRKGRAAEETEEPQKTRVMRIRLAALTQVSAEKAQLQLVCSSRECADPHISSRTATVHAAAATTLRTHARASFEPGARRSHRTRAMTIRGAGTS